MAKEEALQLDKLTKTYVRIRDRRAELRAAFDAEDQKLAQQQDAIRRALLDYCKEHGVESVRTPSGVFYRTLRTRYWAADWGAMHEFIVRNGAPELLERRLNQSAVKAYLEEHPDNPPPGLNVDAEYTLSVRKA